MPDTYLKLWITYFSKSKCEYCGKNFDHIHHILPRSLGGLDEYHNLICLCFDCHLKAHNGAFSTNTGINTEMAEQFKEITINRLEQSVKYLPTILYQKKQYAESRQWNAAGKKRKIYYKGQAEAFEEVLQIITRITHGDLIDDKTPIREAVHGI